MAQVAIARLVRRGVPRPMEEILEEDGYQSPDGSDTVDPPFHLTTSDEFCHDGSTRRTRARASTMDHWEELDMAELKLWDQEDATGVVGWDQEKGWVGWWSG